MKRFFKIIFTLLFISLLTVIGLVTFIDPNRYKTNIVDAVQKNINQPFAINGDIHWHLGWQISFLLEDAQIGEPQEQLHIKEMKIELPLLPLLSQNVDMKINDVTIHWQDGNKEQFDAKLENVKVNVSGLTHTSDVITIDTIHIDHLSMDKIYFDLLAMLAGLTPKQVIINDLTIDEFALGKLSFAAISTKVDTHKDMMTMKPFNAELFKGKLMGDMTLNLQKSNPEAQINAHIKHADLSQLLTYMAPDNQITGSIDMDIKVAASGLDSQLMQQHAEGNAQVDIEQCIYHGDHLGKALQDTVASVNNLKDAEALLVDSVTLTSAMIAQNQAGNKITGIMTIHKGIVDAIDLMVNDQFPVKRYGPIDLPHQLIDLCFDFQKKP
jgi:uncharacterized protein involved in outer membrane biogenesis